MQELAENGGISANTNACFAMVQGEYTAMLDHDDMLTENALAEVVWILQKQPETDFLYSDQDMLEEDSSKRFNPLYKLNGRKTVCILEIISPIFPCCGRR